MQESVRERIKALFKSKNISINKIAGGNGTLQRKLQRQINEDTTLTLDTIDVIKAYIPEVNLDWLMTGEGKMITEEVPVPEISYTDGIPYYDVDFKLGFDEMLPQFSERPEYLIKMPGYENATLWCNAHGHSMEPEISNGDMIALKRIEDLSFLPFGDIYGIITTNGLRTIKRLGRSDREGCYRLIPTNPDYDEQDIPIESISIVYRVLGAMKSF